MALVVDGYQPNVQEGLGGSIGMVWDNCLTVSFSIISVRVLLACADSICLNRSGP